MSAQPRRQQQPAEPVDVGASRIPRSRARRAEVTRPIVPTGFRSSRRTSKAFKQARKALKAHQWRVTVDRVMAATRNRVIGTLTLVGLVILGAVVTVLLLLLVATGVNGYARWHAKRVAVKAASPAAQKARARENILAIGVEDGKARGFLAIRIDEKDDQAFGFAIPDAALMEVPGQGFERVGESYLGGAKNSMATISNYLTVPFDQYVIVPYDIYQEAVTQQRVDDLLPNATETNLDAAGMRRLTSDISHVARKDVALAPLPVKAVKVGEETYYEPERAEVADLLKSWWGVTMTQTSRVVRVIIYNGSGEPGVAGAAARALIKEGFRVVSTSNADKFNYKETHIVIEHGSPTDAQRVADVLRVGKIRQQPSDQEIADIIVIIGKDYEPSSDGG